MKSKPIYTVPDRTVLEKAVQKYRYKRRYRIVLRSTLYALVVAAALAVLVATLWTPVLQIYGSSMTPTLSEGQFVVSLKGANFRQGDLVSFYIGNKLLVKRVIAVPGDWVNISEDGTVYINDIELEEPYVDNKAFGQCDGCDCGFLHGLCSGTACNYSVRRADLRAAGPYTHGFVLPYADLCAGLWSCGSYPR